MLSAPLNTERLWSVGFSGWMAKMGWIRPSGSFISSGDGDDIQVGRESPHPRGENLKKKNRLISE
jgi:hypothetical protein